MKASIAALFIALSFHARAAVVIAYTSQESTTVDPITQSQLDPGANAQVLTHGSGVTANTGSTYNFRDWTTNPTADPDDYFQWGFSVKAGFEIDLTQLQMRIDRSGTGADDVDLLYSLDGFATAGTSIFTHDFNDSSSGVSFGNIDLSGEAPLQDLTGGDTVTFRLFAFAAESSGGTFDIENDAGFVSSGRGIVVIGDVIPLNAAAAAVPEPASLALFGIGALMLRFVRRRDA